MEIRCRLALSGFESRFERSGPLWSYDHASFYPRDFVSVFGRQEQGQYFSEVPKRHVPMAMTGRSDNSPHAHDLSAFPVSFAVRPVEPRLRRPRAEGWHLDAAGVRVHGRPCVTLLHQEARYNGSSAPGTYLMQIWVDQERDFALVQYEEGEDGHVYFHSELENEQHPSGEWLPARWKTSFFRAVEPYELTQHTQVDRVAWQFGEPSPEDTFLVPRPPRTWVTGEPEGEYVVLAGGAKRMVLPEELRRGATHEELLSTPTGQAALERGPSTVADWQRWRGLLGAVGLLGVVVTGAWLAFSRRTRSVGS